MSKPNAVWTHNCCKCKQPLMFTNDHFTGFAYHPICAPGVEQEGDDLALVDLFQGRSAADRVRELLQELAAARLAGKIEGMEEAVKIAWAWRKATRTLAYSEKIEDDAEAHHQQAWGAFYVASAIRAKIAELEATTTPASPGSSEEIGT